MIIEDDSIVAMDIKRVLQSHGWSVVGTASNANDAFKIAEDQRIDLVISDINIEGEIDGIECSGYLQKSFAIPVIFITAYRDTHLLKRVSDLDFIGYLVKPFRVDELEVLLDIIALEYQEQCKVSEKYTYNFKTQVLLYDGEEIELTQKEHKFIALLLKSNGSLVTYDLLQESIWNGEEVSDEARRQFIFRLKQKVGDFPIELLKGSGYRLQKPDSLH